MWPPSAESLAPISINGNLAWASPTERFHSWAASFSALGTGLQSVLGNVLNVRILWEEPTV